MVRRLALALGLLLVASAAGAQVLTQPLKVADEGTVVTPSRFIVNFIGSPVTCADDAANFRTNCTITGGGAGNFLEQSISMTGGAGVYSVTVTGQTWVTSSSIIVCGLLGTTADGLTPEQVAAADLAVSVANRVAGVGFDIFVTNPTGSSGTHRVHCTGA